jgi:hypothetical protein
MRLCCCCFLGACEEDQHYANNGNDEAYDCMQWARGECISSLVETEDDDVMEARDEVVDPYGNTDDDQRDSEVENDRTTHVLFVPPCVDCLMLASKGFSFLPDITRGRAYSNERGPWHSLCPIGSIFLVQSQ